MCKPPLGYKEQTCIDPHCIEMASAAMVHFGLDPGKCVRFLVDENTGQHEDICALSTQYKITSLQMTMSISLYWGVFTIVKITTTTHNDIVCISFNLKSARSNPPIFLCMQKRGQSCQLSNSIRVWEAWTEAS
jgi:hypothetical protein